MALWILVEIEYNSRLNDWKNDLDSLNNDLTRFTDTDASFVAERDKIVGEISKIKAALPQSYVVKSFPEYYKISRLARDDRELVRHAFMVARSFQMTWKGLAFSKAVTAAISRLFNVEATPKQWANIIFMCFGIFLNILIMATALSFPLQQEILNALIVTVLPLYALTFDFKPDEKYKLVRLSGFIILGIFVGIFFGCQFWLSPTQHAIWGTSLYTISVETILIIGAGLGFNLPKKTTQTPT